MTGVQTPSLTEEKPRVDRSRYWRLADLAQFSDEDGFRYEIINGELMMTAAPARPHGVVASRLALWLPQHLLEHRSDWSLIAQPINLEIETERETFHCEPDLSIFDQTFETLLADKELFPVIVIEIVSPGNPDNDYVRKVRAYAALGIPEYWIADPRHRTVTFLELSGEGPLRHYERLANSKLLPALTLDVDALFAGIE